MNQINEKIYELNMRNTKSFIHNEDINSLISMTSKIENLRFQIYKLVEL